MKKMVLLAIVVMAAMVLVTGCANEQESIPVVRQASALATATPTTVPQMNFGLPDGYDPASEEDDGFYTGGEYDAYGKMIQVGATPIPLDPIDMPTATPRPSLVFTYTTITATTLGVTFDAPADWIVDESIPGTITLYDPITRDGYQGFISLTSESKASSFKTGDIKTELNNYVAGLHKTNFDEWRTENIASRTLMGKDGYYTTFRGVRYDGVIIRGRVHMALLDGNRLLTVHVSAPGWYNESYSTVFYKIRDTLKAIQ